MPRCFAPAGFGAQSSVVSGAAGQLRDCAAGLAEDPIPALLDRKGGVGVILLLNQPALAAHKATWG